MLFDKKSNVSIIPKPKILTLDKIPKPSDDNAPKTRIKQNIIAQALRLEIFDFSIQTDYHC